MDSGNKKSSLSIKESKNVCLETKTRDCSEVSSFPSSKTYPISKIYISSPFTAPLLIHQRKAGRELGQQFLRGFFFLPNDRISPAHVHDPDADGDEGQEAADDEIDPPQLGDDIVGVVGALEVEYARAKDGLFGKWSFTFFLLFVIGRGER